MVTQLDNGSSCAPSPRRDISGNRVVSGPVRGVMIALVMPVLAEQLLNALVGLVDTFLAGNLPTQRVEATSAVGLAT